MKNIFLLLILLIFVIQPVWAEDKPLNIVATQNIFADLIKRVGGNRVIVSAVASPKYNIHFIQPKPSDVRKVSKADLYFNGGLDLEAWSDPLLEAAGRPDLFRNAPHNVDLSVGINLLDVPDHPVTRAEGDIHVFGNPHFQMNPENAKAMVRIITAKLSEIDPSHDSYYQANATQFLKQLEQKITEWKTLCAKAQGKEIISYHEDIAYFAEFLGVKDSQYLEPKPGIPPTPKHIQFLEDYVKTHPVIAIVMPSYYPREQAEAIAKRLGIKVITIAQGVGEVSGTEDFFSFFDYDFKQISEVL